MLRIGIDTGGTFTDIAVLDEQTGQYRISKVPSTPDDPARAIIDGIRDCTGEDVSRVILIVHGTTVATNAVLERRGARTALLTTEGFRDVLHIQRQDRPSLYKIRDYRPLALIERHDRHEIRERLRYDGSVQTPIDDDALWPVLDGLAAQGIESVAIAFLHSYANPCHEQQLAAALKKRLPELSVSMSHVLSGERGEYERFSTCAMNAYVQPVMQRYLTRLQAGLKELDINAPLCVMKSNGGVMQADHAAQHCVQTLLSGPAGGVVAGQALALSAGFPNLITADMGGTSFDVSVIHDGRPAFARDGQIGGLAINIPMLDIHTIGAGGGSIASVDAGGALRVGPDSAGADPGPACYGRGGSRPTVTDANLVLGRLGRDSRLAGFMALDVEASERAIHEHVAQRIERSVAAAAEGILRVVNAAMTRAIRRLTIERGLDPRAFALCPFGGAGPLHAVDLARELGITDVIVPATPGVLSATGLLMSELREDRVCTFVAPLDEVALCASRNRIDQISAELRHALGTFGENAVADARVGLRYVGQSYEVSVPFHYADDTPADLHQRFHTAHAQMYGYSRADAAVEMASIWVTLSAGLERIDMQASCARYGDAARPAGTREVGFGGRCYDTPVISPDALREGHSLKGPLIIEQVDTTIVVGPSDTAQRLDSGNIHIAVGEGI